MSQALFSSILGSVVGTTSYDKDIERVTSNDNNVNGQINYAAFLDVADCLKSGKWNAKSFSLGLAKRLEGEKLNGNVLLNTLGLMDTCVKNAGDGFLACFSCREVVDQMASLVRTENQQVRLKAREYLQTWALLFKGREELFMMVELYEGSKRLGIDFPAVSIPISSALVETTLAPPWTDSETCHRCRTAFTTFNRKHHCRNCGNVFCQECSSKSIPLPALGLTEAVRVCDTCHFKITSKSGSTKNLLVEKQGSGGGHAAAQTTRDEEDEALQKAIAASLEISNGGGSGGIKRDETPVRKQQVSFSPDVTSPGSDDDLERAIQESLREEKERQRQVERDQQLARDREREKEKYLQRQREQDTTTTTFQPYQPSITTPLPHQQEPEHPSLIIPPQRPSADLSQTQLENISLFATLVESTAHEISQKGYTAFNPLPLQTLFAQVSTLHPQLTASLQESADKYKELYEMNGALHDVIGAYDVYLQQRLLYSQGGGGGVGGGRGVGLSSPVFSGAPYPQSIGFPPPQQQQYPPQQQQPGVPQQHQHQLQQQQPQQFQQHPTYQGVPAQASQPMQPRVGGGIQVQQQQSPPPVQFQGTPAVAPYGYGQQPPLQRGAVQTPPPQPGGYSPQPLQQSQTTSFSGNPAGYQQMPPAAQYQGMSSQPSQPPTSYQPYTGVPMQPMQPIQPIQPIQPMPGQQPIQPQPMNPQQQPPPQQQPIHVPEAPQDAPLIEL